MTAQKGIFSEPWRTVFDRAQEHSVHSASRVKYMNTFESTLKLLREHGEHALIDSRPTWQDATERAAEIEALSAYRALQHWGTRWGLYTPTSDQLRYRLRRRLQTYRKAA